MHSQRILAASLNVGLVMFVMAIASVAFAWLAFAETLKQIQNIFCRQPNSLLGPLDVSFDLGSCSSMTLVEEGSTTPAGALTLTVLLESVFISLRTMLLLASIGTTLSFALYSAVMKREKSYSYSVVLLVSTALAQIPSVMAYGIVASNILSEIVADEGVGPDPLTGRGLFHGSVANVHLFTTLSFALNMALLVFGHALSFAKKSEF